VSEQDRFCLSCGARLDVQIITSPVSKPTSLWYVIAFVLNILGGIIGYFAVKDNDQNMANRLLIVGFVSLVLLFIFLFVGIPLLFLIASQQQYTTWYS
jgi:hypothetical protein